MPVIAAAGSSVASAPHAVKLTFGLNHDQDGAAVSTMRDDGLGSNSKAGDGVCTCTLTKTPQSTGTESYHTACEGLRSDPVTIRTFPMPTVIDAIKAKGIIAHIDEIATSCRSEEGFVSADRRRGSIGAVAAYAADLKANGKVLEQEVSDNGVVITLASGLTTRYIPEDGETAGRSMRPVKGQGDASPDALRDARQDAGTGMTKDGLQPGSKGGCAPSERCPWPSTPSPIADTAPCNQDRLLIVAWANPCEPRSR